MRQILAVLVVPAVLALAAVPAAAQDLYSLERSNELRAEQMMANQRAVALENQFNALEARIRTEEGLRTLRDQAEQPRQRIPSQPSTATIPTATGSSVFATIPDDRLAASNARVRAASGNRP